MRPTALGSGLATLSGNWLCRKLCLNEIEVDIVSAIASTTFGASILSDVTDHVELLK